MIKYIAAFILLSCAASASTTEVPVVGDAGHLFQLTSADVETAVSEALIEKGSGEKISASVIGYEKSKPLFSYSKPISVEIRGLTFDATTHRWNASVMAVSETSEVISALPVNGRFEEVADVVVLKKQIRAGEVIGEDDIEIRRFPVARTRAETVTNPKEIIGQSPKRTISAGRPIRIHEIAGPTLVQKNGIVQVRYNAAGIEITTAGQAMESGSKGELIAIKNLSSKKVIHAVIDSESTVSIPTPPTPKNISASTNTGASYAAN
jgi:flagella basal body P-ring formation protein FlgA